MSKSRSRKSVGQAFLSSPLVVVLTVATLTVFVFSFAAYARRGGFWSAEVEARVFNEAGRRTRVTDGGSRNQRVFAFQGEVYDEAEQVSKSAALLMGTTLLAAQRSLERKPFVNVASLVAGVVSEGLLPPGLKQESGANSFSSEHAVYYIRYRPEPLGVEVLSVGKGNEVGSAILARLPDDEFFEHALTYYVLPKGTAEMPAAFTPVARLMEGGWRPESFKASEVSTSEQEEQRAWLAARGLVNK